MAPQRGDHVFSPILVVAFPVSPGEKLETEIEDRRIARRDDEKYAARRENSTDLPARAIEVGDELERAHTDRSVERAVVERHFLRARRNERRPEIDLVERGRYAR